jgi:RNA polymerase sigma factor (sigma-70 family)
VVPANELAELWRCYAASLLLLARARSDQPEDCVQEAFIRLAKQTELPDDPQAWLATVVRRVAIDLARSSQRRRRRESDRNANAEIWFDVPSTLVEQETIQLMMTAMKELDVEAREIITAHLWGRLSFRQLADVFGQSSSTIYRRYAEAIEQLRVALDKCKT